MGRLGFNEYCTLDRQEAYGVYEIKKQHDQYFLSSHDAPVNRNGSLVFQRGAMSEDPGPRHWGEVTVGPDLGTTSLFGSKHVVSFSDLSGSVQTPCQCLWPAHGVDIFLGNDFDTNCREIVSRSNPFSSLPIVLRLRSLAPWRRKRRSPEPTEMI